MKKTIWALMAGLLLASSVSIQAGDKRYLIELAGTDGSVFGTPVAFQEIEPGPAPLAVPGPVPVEEPPIQRIQPVPETAPGIVVPSPGPAEYQTVELYPRVKYDDLDNIHPFAVKKIVAVKDPRTKKDPCLGCAPPCVFVMICVPPNERFKYEVKRKDHSKIEYDYGDYEVEITSKNGVIEVDYDD